MRRSNTFYYSWAILIMAIISMNFAFAYGGAFKKDTIYSHYKKLKSRPSYLKNGLPFALPPVRPGAISSVKFPVAKADDKLLSEVEVYPNPIAATDQLNLKYVVSRNTNVSIKIMDVLGNDIATVFQSRTVDIGEQKFSYSLSGKVSRGFYFVRIAAGTESVIKRISVL